MNFVTDNLGQLNWLAIAVAFLVTMPIDFWWYNPRLGFGSRWMKLIGISGEDLENPQSMGKTFGSMLAAQLLTAIILACLIHALGINTWGGALGFGIIVGAVIRGGAHFVHNGFSMKSMQLTLIDTGFDLVSITLMALILGIWW